MSTSYVAIIDFLLSRASDTPLDAAGLQTFTGELKARINQLSVTVPDAAADAVTVLYSGLLPDGQSSGAVVSDLVAGSQIGRVRTIAQTEIGMLLDIENSDFHDALRVALGNDAGDYKQLIDGTDLSGNRVSSDSLWDDASRRFVSNTTGAVRVISTDGLSDSVFAQSELPELFNNPSITEIDGIPRDQYLDLLNSKGLDAVRDVIYTNSGVQIQLSDLSSGNLQKYIDLDPGNNFDNYFELYKEEATRTRLLTYFDALDPERLSNLKAVNASAIEVGEGLVNGGLARSANKLGMLGAAAGFMLASYSSSIAEESGDHERAKHIMAEWAVDAAGSAAGEAIGASIGGVAVAIIAGAGATISAPVTGAIVLGAALIGGIFGAEGAIGIYELTKDQDNNGKIDLLDRLSDLLFAEDFTITETALPGFEGNQITLDTSFSRGKIIENAKASIAWRYALEHLNPFVIEGDDNLYARHNQNNELDLGNFSDQYLNDRAEMLLWRMRFDKAGESYTEEWNTWELTGDWDFIDHRILINGQQPLKLAIDGWNGFPPTDIPNHQVVFGSNSGDMVTGGESSDYLYGRAGDDRLEGKSSEDYLEGGTGNDIYIYNTGDGFDTIYDSDGLGSISYNGDTLEGGVSIGDGLFASSDGQIIYRFDDSGNGTGTLLIDNNILIEQFDSNAEAFLDIALKRDRIDDSVITETIISGSPGDDLTPSLDGGNDSDHIKGFTGNDWARGFLGADLIEGGPGNDILEGGQDNDVIHGDSADGVAWVVESNEQEAGISHDWLGGNEGDDQLYGSSGADVLVGGEGDDLVWGGAGNDVIQGDSERVPLDHSWVDAWIGSSELQSGGTLNPLGSGNDILLGGAGTDQIWGQAGDDVINGGIGDDLISGDMVGLSEQGNRLLSGEFHGDDVINGDGGNDIVEGGGGNDMLFGGDGNDTLYGDAESVLMPDVNSLLLRAEYHGRDSLYGDAGDDLLVGGGESDILEGGAGADSLYGDDETSGLDPVSHGDDILRGGSDNDLLMGNGGSDQLYGDSGDDKAWGGDGDDYISGGTGGDYLVGDNGLESAVSDGEDTLLGGTGGDILYGSGGDDHLGGGAGDDQLHGGDGDDRLEGGADGDYLVGGSGADTYLFNAGDGIDVIDGDADDKVSLPAIPEVATSLTTGADGTDFLAIRYGKNEWIFVQGGLETAVDRYELNNGRVFNKRDLLNETLITPIEYRMRQGGEIAGGRYGDTLVGSFENDTIHGQEGDDILAGGGGDDYLLGGAGIDLYRIGRGTGRDSISEQANAVNHLELFADVSIDDLSYEREGDDLFIRIAGGRDGVLLEEYYNLNQTWRITDQFGEIMLNRGNEPQITQAALADSMAAAWQEFNQRIESAYGGLLLLQGFDEKADGSFERSYSGGDVNNRWKKRYSVAFSTQTLEQVSGSYRRMLADIETNTINIHQNVSVQEQVHFSGLSSGYVSAGRSGTDYVSVAAPFNGISVQESDQLIADYGLNSWRNPLTGALEQEIKGYFVYPSATSVPTNTPVYRLYTETDYQVKANIAAITAGSGDDEILTGATRFNLIDGGGGNDLIDTSQADGTLQVPGRSNLEGVRMPGSLLFGNSGDDELYGGALDDVLIGGQGRDLMSGGKGEDTYYLFDTDAGDRIVEWGEERIDGQGDDLLVLPDGIGFNDLAYAWGESVETDDFIEPLRFGRQVEVPAESMHTTLKLSWADSEGVTIVLPHSDKGAGLGIDSVLARNGEKRSFLEVIGDAGPGPGQDRHDQDNVFGGRGILSGGAGNDRLTAAPNEYYPESRGGVSVLIGGAGTDYLQGGDGYNILIGGQPIVLDVDGFTYNRHFIGTFWGDAGNTFSGGRGFDELWTTEGSDTILFGLGDGVDIVDNTASSSDENQLPRLLNGLDILKFGEGIAPEDISVTIEQKGMYKDSLLFSHTNGEDRLYFRNWRTAETVYLNQVEFVNGTVWKQNHILALAAGTSIDTPPVLQAPLNDFDALETVPFSIAIPESTFTHADGLLAYSIELADGSQLPGWMSFDADRLLLSGIPGSDKIGSWDLRVIASSGYALSASDLFTLRINQVAGELVTGDLSDDRLTGTDAGDVIAGGGGTNELRGLGGDDWFPVVGDQQGINIFNGGEGVDRIQGSAGDDLIRLSIFSGDDRVEIIDGGEGSDTLSGDDSANTIDLRDVQIIGVERIDGQGGNDAITGSMESDHIYGGKGNDRLHGGRGDDRLRGGSGRDSLFGGSGDDDISGGTGNDRIKGGRGDDHLVGGDGADEIWGGRGGDSVHGSAGQDLIRGGSGSDTLHGGAGDDKIKGGRGKDAIYGGAGDDLINGGTGADHLYAGDGNDRLLFGRDYGHDRAVMGSGAQDELDLFVDRVMFRTGISPDQLWFERRNNHLDVSIIGTGDKLTVNHWYANDASKADEFITSNGSLLVRDNVDQLVSAMAGFDPPPVGEIFLPEELRVLLEPIIAASWQ